MKKFLKNNILIIISVLLLSIISINSCLTEFRERDTNKLNYKTYVEECKSYNGEYGTEELKNWCENVINNPTIKFNFFEVLSDLIGWHSEILRNLGIALLLVPSIYAMTRLKQKNAYNYLIREDYKKYKNRIYKNGFKYIWLLPSLFILMVVLVGFYTKFNFSVESTNAIVWSANSTNNIFLFLISILSLLLS